MDSGDHIEPKVVVHKKGITFETLGLIIVSVVLGVAAAVLAPRFVGTDVETISTTDLIGFFSTVVLVVSATVLAIAAICLSRMAEQSISTKAEEMRVTQAKITMQAEQTIERLEESLLLVSEEMVEAIYEKFDDLSDEVRASLPLRDVLPANVVHAVEHTVIHTDVSQPEETSQEPPIEDEPIDEEGEMEPPVPEEVSAVPLPIDEEPEELVDQAVVDEEAVLSDSDNEPVPEEEKVDVAEKKYDEFKDIVLHSIANYPDVKVDKMGEGHYRTEGDDLVDGAFQLNHERVAVCTFATANQLDTRFQGQTGDRFSGFLDSICNEIKKSHFTRVFFVFDGELSGNSPYTKAMNQFINRVDAVTFSKFELFEGSPVFVVPELTKRVCQLMLLKAEEESDEALSFQKDMPAGD